MAVTGRPTGVANTGDSSVLAVRVLEDAVLQEAPPKQAAPTEGGWLGVLGGCSRGGRVGGASPCGVGTEPRACTPASVAAPMAASRPVLLATWSDAWPCGGKRGGGVSWWRAHEFGLVEWHLRVSVSTRAKQGAGGTSSVGCRLTVEPDPVRSSRGTGVPRGDEVKRKHAGDGVKGNRARRSRRRKRRRLGPGALDARAQHLVPLLAPLPPRLLLRARHLAPAAVLRVRSRREVDDARLLAARAQPLLGLVGLGTCQGHVRRASAVARGRAFRKPPVRTAGARRAAAWSGNPGGYAPSDRPFRVGQRVLRAAHRVPPRAHRRFRRHRAPKTCPNLARRKWRDRPFQYGSPTLFLPPYFDTHY